MFAQVVSLYLLLLGEKSEEEIQYGKMRIGEDQCAIENKIFALLDSSICFL